MKTFLVVLSILGLIGCAGVQRTYTMTPEGWVVVYTNSQSEVASLCGEEGNDAVVGCALTPLKTEYPSKLCDVYIYTGEYPMVDEDLISDTLQHELRHCREGAFHQ